MYVADFSPPSESCDPTVLTAKGASLQYVFLFLFFSRPIMYFKNKKKKMMLYLFLYKNDDAFKEIDLQHK